MACDIDKLQLSNTDAKRFAEQFVGEVTEHGLDAVTGEINMAGPANDDYGIGVFF